MVRAWDTASGIASLTLLLDGALFDHAPMVPDTSTGTPGFVLAVPPAGPPGSHVVMARAADRVGLTAEAQISYVLPGRLLVSDVAAVPSPASGPTWITALVSISGDLRAAIYTPAGRLIRLLDGRADYPGRAGLEWDLLDHDGDRVANGAYLVHVTLRTGTASASAKGSLIVRR
ncbi:MAG: hypothetical protein MUE60_13955 [Candidatus Eisenbacteria bacterium]|nr:hypothetical protein [Candidatus Eisenbacteria bacterium]